MKKLGVLFALVCLLIVSMASVPSAKADITVQQCLDWFAAQQVPNPTVCPAGQVPVITGACMEPLEAEVFTRDMIAYCNASMEPYIYGYLIWQICVQMNAAYCMDWSPQVWLWLIQMNY